MDADNKNPQMDPKEINIMDWHAVDEEFSRYTIYGFGKDIKGKNYTIKVTHYNPEMYIRIINKNTANSNDFMENLEKDQPRLNKLLDSINYICSKKLNCEDKKNAHVVKSFKIKEYPSYVLTAKGKNYVYDANLHPESLERFFQAVYKKI